LGLGIPSKGNVVRPDVSYHRSAVRNTPKKNKKTAPDGGASVKQAEIRQKRGGCRDREAEEKGTDKRITKGRERHKVERERSTRVKVFTTKSLANGPERKKKVKRDGKKQGRGQVDDRRAWKKGGSKGKRGSAIGQ